MDASGWQRGARTHIRVTLCLLEFFLTSTWSKPELIVRNSVKLSHKVVLTLFYLNDVQRVFK